MLGVYIKGLRNAIEKTVVIRDAHKRRLVRSALARLVESEIKDNIASGRDSSGNRQKPSRRFGRPTMTPLLFRRRLINGIRAVVTTRGIRVISGADHASTQEKGGTLGPRTKQYLLIPFYSFVWEAIRRQSARDAFPNARVIPVNGKLYLADKGRRGLLGVLKRNVTVPARPHMGLSFDQRRKVGMALERELVRVWGST
jgi:hypothetical protein